MKKFIFVLCAALCGTTAVMARVTLFGSLNNNTQVPIELNTVVSLDGTPNATLLSQIAAAVSADPNSNQSVAGMSATIASVLQKNYGVTVLASTHLMELLVAQTEVSLANSPNISPAAKAQALVNAAQAFASVAPAASVDPSFVAMFNQAAAAAAQGAAAIVATPGFADANPQLAGQIAISAAAVVAIPDVAKANPTDAAAAVVAASYVAALTTVQDNNPGIVNSVANSVAGVITATGDTSISSTITNAQAYAQAKAGIEITITSSVNPTVVSVSQ